MASKPASIVIPSKLIAHIRREGGALALMFNNELSGDEKWMASYHFGKEAEDSDMVGGAAYGIGQTAADAFGAMMNDLGDIK